MNLTKNITRATLLCISLFACVARANAGTCARKDDSLKLQRTINHSHWSSRYVEYNDRGSKFRVAQLVAPVALIGAGSVIMATPALHKAIDAPVHNYISGRDLKEPAGDYLQYLPMLGAYGLNLAGYRGKHSYLDATVILATSYATMGILVNGIKYSVRRPRPDNGRRNSFTSGHTATAFMGAEFLRREYCERSPWVGVAGYVVATGVGVSRIINDRHWVSDVIAGAGVGILSVQVAYWLFPPLQRLIYGVRKDGTPRKDVAMSASPWWNGEQAGASLSLCF